MQENCRGTSFLTGLFPDGCWGMGFIRLRGKANKGIAEGTRSGDGLIGPFVVPLYKALRTVKRVVNGISAQENISAGFNDDKSKEKITGAKAVHGDIYKAQTDGNTHERGAWFF